MIVVCPAYLQRIASVLKKCIYRVPFRALLHFVVDSTTPPLQVIVKACIVLHNLMRLRYPGLQNQHLDRAENMNRDVIPGAWRQDRNLQDTHTVAGRNTSTNKAKKQRNLLKHWANSGAGAVPWQDRMT